MVNVLLMLRCAYFAGICLIFLLASAHHATHPILKKYKSKILFNDKWTFLYLSYLLKGKEGKIEIIRDV